MSWSTFRERWQLFAGAIITVCLGVALVQSSLLTLISAADPTIPPGLSEVEEATLREGYESATALLGMILALATFVAVFIVGSTFAFTVAQRRRDLALLRLTGASRRQVRVLLIGEALLLGAAGTALGVLFGLPVMRFETWMLVRLDFVPPGFAADWRSWVIAVSAGTGVGVAVLGVLGASRRASRVRPLEALRDIGQAARVMTWSRWLIGIIHLAGGIAMLAAAPAAGGDGALALSLFVCIVLVIAFSALSPLVVPLVGRLLGLFARGSLIGELAHANLRDGVRRSAATAAPIMVLVGLVVGLGGTLDAITAGSRAEAARTLNGDLMVTADRPIAVELSKIDGVRVVSEEVPIVLTVDDGTEDGMAIDPATYSETHRMKGVEGDLGALRGQTVVVTRGSAPSSRVGGILHTRISGQERDLRIVASLPITVAGPAYLLPHEFASADATQRRYVVQADNPAAVAGSGLGQVSTVADWIRHDVSEQQQTNLKVMVALLGMATLYTIIAMINAVVIAAADRGAEFAAARLTGLSRGQVVRATLWESLAVVAVGVLLGGLAAGGTVVGFAAAISHIVGTSVVSVPWQLFAGLLVVSAAIVGVTSVLTTRAATRQPPLMLSE